MEEKSSTLVDAVVQNLPFDPVDIMARIMYRTNELEHHPKFGFFHHVEKDTGRWVGWPRTDKKGAEHQLCEYLNTIAEKIRFLKEMPESPDDLVFSSEFKGHGPPSTRFTYDRAPDLVVIPRSKVGANAEWSDIRGVVSLKVANRKKVEELEQLAEYARVCFATQYDRRHVLGLGFLHKRLTLYLFDRSGVTYSREYNVDEYPEIFLRVAIGILFLDQRQLGYDESFVTEPDSDSRSLTAGGVQYKILDKIYLDRSLRGRGTVCLKAERMSGGEEGRVCVVKDAWVDRNRATNEIEMVKFLKEKSIANIPEFLFGAIVKKTDQSGNEVDDSTEYFRGRPAVAEIRDHYRIVMTPYGEPLWKFTCLTELISATLDVVESKQFLSYHAAQSSFAPSFHSYRISRQ